MIEPIRNFLQTYLDLSAQTQNRLFISLLILIVLWLVRLLATRFVNERFQGNVKAQYNWRKVIQYTTVVLGILLVGRVWLEGIQSVATYLGLLSAGIAIALQDLLINLAGWAYLVWQRPFKVGDRIEIDDSAGDVIDISLLEFTLLEIGHRINAEQSTGRLIHMPNGLIFKAPLINAHQGIPFIWHEVPVMLTFESDWEKAKRILVGIIRHYAPDPTAAIEAYRQRSDKRFVITYTDVKPTVYTAVASSGVLLTIRYLIDPRKLRSSEQQIWEAILKGFAPHWDIDFAYETVREYVNWREGKRPPQPDKPETHRGQPVYGKATDTRTRVRTVPPPASQPDKEAHD